MPPLKYTGSLYLSPETKVSNFSLGPNQYAKRLKPRFRPTVPSHWQTQKKKLKISSVPSVAVICIPT